MQVSGTPALPEKSESISPGSTVPGVIRRVVFRLSCSWAPAARQVSVVGPFNSWDPHMHLLVHDPREDCWTTVVFLPPGEYAYLYDVDGNWQNDPDDDGRIPTGRGGAFSLKVVK